MSTSGRSKYCSVPPLHSTAQASTDSHLLCLTSGKFLVKFVAYFGVLITSLRHCVEDYQGCAFAFSSPFLALTIEM